MGLFGSVFKGITKNIFPKHTLLGKVLGSTRTSSSSSQSSQKGQTSFNGGFPPITVGIPPDSRPTRPTGSTTNDNTMMYIIVGIVAVIFLTKGRK